MCFYTKIMIKLDLKDRKILYELDQNSRQALSQLGKKVGLPKNVVAYRIKRLEKKGIIKNYYTIIDASKLGYISFRIYLNFQYTTPEIEKEIIDYFIKNKHTYWIGSITGKFNLVVIMWVKNVNDFYNFWQDTLNKYRDYIQDQLLTFYFQLIHYKYTYLLPTKKEKGKAEVSGGSKKIKTDSTDFMILRILSKNARVPVTEIAKKLNTTPTVVKYRIKKLTKLGVIQGYRTRIDLLKLGYLHYKVDIFLKDYKRVNDIIKYIKFCPNLVYLNKTVGYADIEIELHYKNLTELEIFMNDLKTKFKGLIKNHTYFVIDPFLKIQYMPEE